VNSKSGRYLRSFSLLAVFLYWPSALDVSHCARVAQSQPPACALQCDAQGQEEAETHRNLALELDRLDDGLGDLLDRDLVLLANREDDRVDLGVLCDGTRSGVSTRSRARPSYVGGGRTLELPDEELGEVARVDELPQGRARAGDGEGRAVLCEAQRVGQLALFNEETQQRDRDALLARRHL